MDQAPAARLASQRRHVGQLEIEVPGNPHRIVILYGHPMLGEGIASLLRGGPDVAVELVHVEEPGVVPAALAGDPDVVIIERGAGLDPIALLPLAPTALFIDVGLDPGPTWTLLREQVGPNPEEILRLVGERVHPRCAEPAASIEPATVPAAR